MAGSSSESERTEGGEYSPYSSADEEDTRTLGEIRENRCTIGAARKARLSRRTGGATRNSRPATAAAAAVSSRKKAGARKPSVVMKKKRKRRESSSQKATAKGKGNAKRKGRRGEVLGILGLPVRGGDVDDDDDSDYDSSASLPPSKGASNSKRPKRVTRSTVGGEGQRKTQTKTVAGGVDFLAGRLSLEVMLHGLIRPFLSAQSKCALQRTCRHMRQVLDKPEAWEALDLRREIIRTHTMKSGRQSHLSDYALFIIARGVVAQPRFSQVTTIDLRRMNIGAMGKSPEVLLRLAENCPHITTLNLLETFLEHEWMPQPDTAIEEVIAEKLPALQHLAIAVGDNKGLKILLQGCRQLKSLHVGSRRNRRGDVSSMCPNDAGLKAFSSVRAAWLETVSFSDKSNIGPAGLRCLLDPEACPRLKTLILANVQRVTGQCLTAITPQLSRLKELILDECPIKPPAIQLVMERCPELEVMVVAGDQSVILQNAQEGLPLLDYVLGPTCKLKTFRVEVRRWQNTHAGLSSNSNTPVERPRQHSNDTASEDEYWKMKQWLEIYSADLELRYDVWTSTTFSDGAALVATPSGQQQRELVIASAPDYDARIARHMAGMSRARVDEDGG